MITHLALLAFVQVAASTQQLAPGAGSILRVILDSKHWRAGTDGEIGVLVEGTRVFSPIMLDHGEGRSCVTYDTTSTDE